MKRYLGLLFIILLPATVIAQPLKLTNLQFFTVDHHAQAVFSFNNNFNYDYFSLEKPNRLVFDFADAQSALPKKILQHKGKLITEIRAGQHKNKLRIVFNLSQALHITLYKTHHCLVVNLLTQKPITEKFSLCANQRAASLVAPCSDNANTEAPFALGLGNESA